MEEKGYTWFGIITFVVTTLINIFDRGTNAIVILPISAVLIAAGIVFLLVARTKRNKNFSNTSVISKSKKYTKFLWKFVKANEKAMEKSVNVSKLQKLTNYNKSLVHKIRGKKSKEEGLELYRKSLELKQKQIDKLIKNEKDYISSKELKVTNSINKPIKKAEYKQSIEIYNNIYQTVVDVERILLQLEQHELRVKLGKYIIKMSYNIDHIIHAYVDLIGWTNVLLGDNKRGITSILNGLDLIEYQIKGLEEHDEKYKYNPKYYDYIYLKARALRHIGTTYYTYKNEKDVLVKESLDNAIKLLHREDVVKYAENNQEYFNKYERMLSGLEYNSLLYDYYTILKNNNVKVENLEIIKAKVEALEKDLDNKSVTDNHRRIKILTFKNELEKDIIMRSIESNNDQEIKDKTNEFIDEIRKDLKTIEETLNQNIYFDEAMEVYICQKVGDLHAKIESVFNQNK